MPTAGLRKRAPTSSINTRTIELMMPLDSCLVLAFLYRSRFMLMVTRNRRLPTLLKDALDLPQMMSAGRMSLWLMYGSLLLVLLLLLSSTILVDWLCLMLMLLMLLLQLLLLLLLQLRLLLSSWSLLWSFGLFIPFGSVYLSGQSRCQRFLSG